MKLIAHCSFSATHSPRPGTAVEAVKLLAIQAPDGPNSKLFADGIGAGTIDLTKLTTVARAEFQAGKVYEVTFKEVTPAPAG